jgi:hypothetical protein
MLNLINSKAEGFEKWQELFSKVIKYLLTI